VLNVLVKKFLPSSSIAFFLYPHPLFLSFSSHLTPQVVVVGQDQRHLGALIVPDWEYLGALAEEAGEAEGFSAREVERRIAGEVMTLVRQRPGYVPHDQVREYNIINVKL
jgi:hypothetical protein